MNKIHLLYLLSISIFLVGCHNKTTNEPDPLIIDPTIPLYKTADGSTMLPNDLNKRAQALLSVINKNAGLTLGKHSGDITDEQVQEIQTFIKKIMAEKNATTMDDKYRVVFTWVNDNIKHASSDNSPYHTFINRKAVCEGFSGLQKVMLLGEEIPCIIINGFSTEKRSPIAHAWTAVYLNKAWRISDPTYREQEVTTENDVTSTKFSPEPIKPLMANRLEPLSFDIPVFEDEYAIYKYWQGYLNVDKVKKANHKGAFICPYSILGMSIDSFNPSAPLPNDINTIYIGDNIRSLGEYGVGLYLNRNQVKNIVIDPNNKYLRSYKNIVYRLQERNENFTTWKPMKSNKPYYIAEKLDSIYLAPDHGTLEKNTISHHENVTDIFVAKNTQYINRYAFEDCPKLQRIHVPKPCAWHKEAFAGCPNAKIILYW